MGGHRLRVGLIGLGDIAAKAYLPVLAADAGVDPVLITRDPERRATLQSAWRIADGFATVEDALASGQRLDAAFVHASTVAHPAIAVSLIDAGIPAFIDKPLALTALEADAVVTRARDAGVSLAVCFNRRFTPAYAEVARWPGLDTVVLTKNRVGLADDPRLVVFDDFVHVVDTLRFLVAPEPDDVQVVARAGAGGALARVAITLRQGGRLGVGVMDRDSGQTIEILDAMAPGRARRVTDLVDVVDRVGGVAEHRQPDNWASVAQQRGFTTMVAGLLASVRAGEVLDGGDALATHLLCDEILSQVEHQVA